MKKKTPGKVEIKTWIFFTCREWDWENTHVCLILSTCIKLYQQKCTIFFSKTCNYLLALHIIFQNNPSYCYPDSISETMIHPEGKVPGDFTKEKMWENNLTLSAAIFKVSFAQGAHKTVNSHRYICCTITDQSIVNLKRQYGILFYLWYFGKHKTIKIYNIGAGAIA